ncbi:unnamed protein product [Schistosoma turkestanicum]|nr:unnamed protein product [Schistosoma turkestanicum]
MFEIQKVMSVENPNLPTSSCGDDVDYYALSPTISQLDHQEIIETGFSSGNPLFGGNSITEKAIPTSNLKLNQEADDLFSFELDTHILPLELLNNDLDSPDFNWTDLLPDSNELVSLEDINPSNFLKCEQIENEKVKFTNNYQNKSLISHSSSISNSLYKKKTTTQQQQQQQQKLLYSSPVLTLSNSTNHHYHHHHHGQVFNSMEMNDNLDSSENDDDDDDDDMNDSYTNTKLICLNNEDLVNGKPGECVKLTAEECKMLQKIGCQLPIKFPLSQTNEKAIRTVRRKIRNKLSAQASRAKRQKYVTDLERRYSMCTEEIRRLRRQVNELEEDKRNLTFHLRKLRSYINKLMNKQNKQSYLPLLVNSNNVELNKHNNKKVTAKQAATAAAGGTSLLLMTFMILMWTAVVPIPSVMKTIDTTPSSSTGNFFGLFPGRSRMLMSINHPSELYSYSSLSSSSSLEIILNESSTFSSDPNIIAENSVEYAVPINQFISPVK